MACGGSSSSVYRTRSHVRLCSMQEPEARGDQGGHAQVVHGPESSVSLRDRTRVTAGARCVPLHSALLNGGRYGVIRARLRHGGAEHHGQHPAGASAAWAGEDVGLEGTPEELGPGDGAARPAWADGRG